MNRVSISQGNIKMVGIPSVSLSPELSCNRNCGCWELCYARKISRLRPNVWKAYERNSMILQENKKQYWNEVEAVIQTSRFFRFHVGGDIPNEEYLNKMISVARKNPHCEILCFTKKYKIVNVVVAKLKRNHKGIPKNLHLILSGWKGYEMENPFHLPEAHVKYKDGTTTARPDAQLCGGNCTECAKTNGGCWNLKKGQQIYFNQH